MIISIDGLDCSGKNTVATALQMKLSSIFKRANINANVIKISFPDKDIINEIYRRRNQIAHQTDRNPPETEKQDIAKDHVERYFYFK